MLVGDDLADLRGLGGDPSRHFYLLFVPLIWIAMRGGMSGAIVAIAVVQLGVVLGIHREARRRCR